MQKTSKNLILVVDDEPSICWALKRMLEEEGLQVSTASSAEEGLSIAKKSHPNLILLDVRLPHESGTSALPKFLAIDEECPVVIMTAFGDLETAVTAVQNGASDYLTKPFGLEAIGQVCRKALQSRPAARNMPKPIDRSISKNEIIGSSPGIQHAYRQTALVAASDLSVLITGETGTGKELFAEAIHRYSDRADQIYLPISPVSLNPDLVESELFGHVKGAFPGALFDHEGLFARAERGTILLDEVGDLSLNVQVKLLRVLEQGSFARVGSTELTACNVRIIAATNTDLFSRVRDGRFREDLYYRLNGMHIHLPPLRERTEDLLPLCSHFLRRLGFEEPETMLNDTLIDSLMHRPWLGNVRELRNAIEHAAIVSRGRILSIEDIPESQPSLIHQTASSEELLEAATTRWFQDRIDADKYAINLHEQLLAQIEPTLFRLALQLSNGNRAKSAELLGIHRGTLRDKLRNYGVDEEINS